MAQIRVTRAGALTEAEGQALVRATKVGALLEFGQTDRAPVEIRASSVGAELELREGWVRASSVGVLLEFGQPETQPVRMPVGRRIPSRRVPFYVRLWSRSFGDVLAPRALLTPVRWSWALPGGPQDAEIEVEGDDVWMAANWLRQPVAIFKENGDVVWWGYVHEVSVNGVRWSLQEMANRVAVEYSYVEPGVGEVGERRMTAWAQDSDSVARYGTKELIASLSGTTDAAALYVRDALLASRRWPIFGAEEGGGTAKLYCRGWWDTLSWRFYQQAETDSVETTQQIAAIVASAGQFLVGVDVIDASGVSTSEYRNGSNTALDEIRELLAIGTSSGSRLTAWVSFERRLVVEKEPTSSATDDWVVDADRRLRHVLGRDAQGEAVLGWARYHDVISPMVLTEYLGSSSPFFIEQSEYDASARAYRWRVRGMPGPWELSMDPKRPKV